MDYRHILVAYDGSTTSDRALSHAVKIAKRNPGGRFTVAHVIHRPLTAFEGFGWVIPEGYQEKLKEYEESLTQKAEAAIKDLPYGRTVMLGGVPAQAILDYAKEYNCDLIVMGSRGLGPFKEWMLGSVSHHVVQQSHIPVLIVK